MAVPCARCGRQYDVTLFAFGRTIHCACGARVGLEPQVGRGPETAEPRFIADAMLERLAHWLRILGFDCAYHRRITDEELVRRALEERRVVLTRDRALPEEWRIQGIYLVSADRALEQLREVVAHFGLSRRARPFSRCSRCNTPLVEATPEEVRHRVPATVLHRHEEFHRCPGCGRAYWEGSHTARMRAVTERVLARGRGRPG